MDELEDALRKLRGDFLVGAGTRLDEMEQALGRLAFDPGDSETARGLLRHFHGLAGAGGSYGLPQVSSLGGEGEHACHSMLDGADAAGGIALCRALTRRLRDAIGAASGSGSPESRGTLEVPARAAARPSDILIVGLGARDRDDLSRELGREGMAVRAASSAPEAEAAIAHRVPDGAVLEAGLPGDGALRLIERIRAAPGGDSVQIVIVGEHGGVESRMDLLHAGADAFLEKPVDLLSLLRRLQFLLERRRQATPRVLSVEDDEHQAAFLKTVLESAGYEVRVCMDPRLFPADLSAFRPDILLMDVNLPGASGYDLVRYVRQEEAYAAMPVLFLTTEGQLDARIEAARAGGDEHLVKPVTPALLLTMVASRVERARFLRSLLERDGLTRLLTHTAFFGRASDAIARRLRDPSKSEALVILDLDRFKDVNDRFGHPVGDQVLVALAALLRRRLRQSDAIGRIGGEEIAILLEDLTLDAAVRLIERLLAEFAATTHAARSGEEFHVTFSAGVALLGAEVASVQTWYAAADAALYEAKRQGRNRVVAAATVPRRL